MRSLSLLFLATALAVGSVQAQEDEWGDLPRRCKAAFKPLELAPESRFEDQVSEQLPPAIVIEAAPFDQLIGRLREAHRPRLDLRRQVVGELAAHPSVRAGKLLADAVKMMVKENEILARRVVAVEKQYAPAYDRGYMEASGGERRIRKLAATLIPFYRSLMFENEAIRDLMVTTMAAMDEGDARSWLLSTAASGRETHLRAAAIQALGRVQGDEARAKLEEVVASDKKSYLRVRALAALMHWKIADVEEVVIGALADEAWEVRALAIVICVRGNLVQAAGPMIEALDRETGRLRKDLDDALFELVGVRMYSDVELWKKWWADHKEEVRQKQEELARSGAHDRVLGDITAWGQPLGAEDAGDRGAEGGDVTSAFYGITTYSKKILYIMDISKSMENASGAKPRAVSTGRHPYADPKGETKIEIARWQLHRAVHDLPRDATCNILVYSESYKLWQDQPMLMKKKAQKSAHAFIDGLGPNGTTNICDSLDKGYSLAGADPLADPRKQDELQVDTIYLLSDGEPNRGRRSNLEALLQDVVGRNLYDRLVIHTIGIGDASGSSFLQNLARQTGGQHVSFE